MKKIIKILLIAIILCISLIGFCGCENSKEIISNDFYHEENKKYDKYYIIHSGYLHNINEKEKLATIISSKSDLNEFILKYDEKGWDLEGNEIDGQISNELQKYDEKYFETKSLALYYVGLTSGSETLSIYEPEIKGDTVIVKYEINVPNIGTCDMSGELIVVEIDKSITKISE